MPILQELAAAMRDTAQKTGHSLNVDIAPDAAALAAHAPLAVPGARDELRQVFQNLVENALRYGAPDSAVRLRVSVGHLATGEARDDGVCVEVVTDHLLKTGLCLKFHRAFTLSDRIGF